MDLQCLLAAPLFPTFPVPRDRPALADLQLSCPSSAGLLSLPREPHWSDFLSAAIAGEASCGLMPSPAELWLQCQKGGSNTPAFDELPLSPLGVVGFMGGPGRLVARDISGGRPVIILTVPYTYA